MPFLPWNPWFKGFKAIKDFKSFKSRIFRCLISILGAYFHFCTPKMEIKCPKILLLKLLIVLKPLNQGFQGKKGILRHFKQNFKALNILLMLGLAKWLCWNYAHTFKLMWHFPLRLIHLLVPSIWSVFLLGKSLYIYCMFPCPLCICPHTTGRSGTSVGKPSLLLGQLMSNKLTCPYMSTYFK